MKLRTTLLLTLLFALPVMAAAATFPVKAVLRLRLQSPPVQDEFSVWLEFHNYKSDAMLVEFEFRKKKDLIYEAVLNAAAPDELARLQKICDDNNRGYWDEMRLVNRGQNVPISIRHLFFKIIYNSRTAGCRNDITIIDGDIDQALESGYSTIYLNSHARLSRLKWVRAAVKKITGRYYEYGVDTCPAFLTAVRDIGKCGTDESSWYDMDPKYGPGDEALCSEFVSWYYHKEGTPFARSEFREIVGSSPFIHLFSYAGRSCEYNPVTRCFENPETGEEVEPKPGDYLRRTDPGHSMMIAGWNGETGTAAVINGPWPVTIRKVEVQKDEESGKHQYQIGIVEDTVPSIKAPV